MSCSATSTLTPLIWGFGSTKQWAAVRMVDGPMIVPPHQGNWPYTTIPTCQGIPLAWGVCPPTIAGTASLLRILPQWHMLSEIQGPIKGTY